MVVLPLAAPRRVASRSRRVVLALALATAAACSSDDPARSAATVRTASSFAAPAGGQDWVQIVPGPGMPADLTAHVSNNNLDIVLFDGHLFLAFRTAPTHFASTDTVIHVVRCDDPERWAACAWQHERSITTGTDLREPRLFVLGERLFLLISRLGESITAFEPGGVMALHRERSGAWSPPTDVFTDGELIWRTKTRGGRVYATGYRGGEQLYQGRGVGEATVAELFLTTDDGYHWRGVDPDRPVVLVSGGSESDFEFDAAGNLFAVVRNETGDRSGFGSKLCRAPAGDLGRWTCEARSDPNKYDSPFSFSYGGDMYLIARYNLGVPYDLSGGGPASSDDFWKNEIRYSTTTKRTALYGVDRDAPAVIPLEVFPSNGDTAFASGVWLDDRRLLVFNYSSDFRGPDMAWIEGQFVGSQIYGAVLDFSAVP